MSRVLQLEEINKCYDDKKIIDNISLSVERGEFLTLIGPSGCGKTTTLRIIGGFEQADSGRVIFEGKDISKLPPNKRNINTVFQNYALFPHLNVFDNVAFGLRIKKRPESEVKQKVQKSLDLVDLVNYGNRDISRLSGGQKQRVAIARALVNEPEIILFDEPLGALDLKLRKRMQVELKNIQKEVGITFIYVTHDQEEALSMSDKIAVMNKGVIEQYGSPQYIYEEPVNAFVANFLGDSNIFKGKMVDRSKVNFLGHDYPCVDKVKPGKNVSVMLRPEYLYLSDYANLSGKVENSMFKGTYYNLRVTGKDFSINVHNPENVAIGTDVCVAIDPDAIHVMEEASDPIDLSINGGVV
ncbi:ABC transporter ATP-binding protein [uncultured Anaerococcus sp.]|uniref:ABC transporter ATP-binding protein n=1 Tax=uncultured Anaerococcus sp. TaxID=293428 RepID=UPI00260208E0|nr:ABC transporter ATP-binding protein [uncultured Anaerococcus sp.]